MLLLLMVEGALDVLLAFSLFLFLRNLVDLILNNHVGVIVVQVIKPEFRIQLVLL